MFACSECDGSFGNKGALGNHCKWKHAQTRLPERRAGGEFACPDCDNAYDSLGGLNVHRRAKHPDVYHAARQPAARVKARWSYEEMVLVARAELEIRGTNPPRGVVRVLHSRFPDRTFEAIKCLRNKNPLAFDSECFFS